MKLPVNEFKRRLVGGETLYGLWASLVDPVAIEISAGAGFDWMLLDGEHAPNDVRTVMAQLQVIDAYRTAAVVRPVEGAVALLKQYLDVGASTLLVPAVESADQASALVRAVRYPPGGIRGVGAARAARWGRIDDYWERADDEVCLLVQIETRAGLDDLEAIAAVPGVDGMFVGPSDLGASLGHLGETNGPEVREAVAAAIGRIVAAGKPAGVLAITPAIVDEYLDAGATFVAVGVDAFLLAEQTTRLRASYPS